MMPAPMHLLSFFGVLDIIMLSSFLYHCAGRCCRDGGRRETLCLSDLPRHPCGQRTHDRTLPADTERTTWDPGPPPAVVGRGAERGNSPEPPRVVPRGRAPGNVAFTTVVPLAFRCYTSPRFWLLHLTLFFVYYTWPLFWLLQ